MATNSWIGRSVLRREDDDLVSGTARFVDDLRSADGLPAGERLTMWVIRSPIAHGRITAVEVTEALDLPGVVAVVTGADIASSISPYGIGPSRDGAGIADAPMTLLAGSTVRYVGDPVAVVLARSPAEAEDAAAQVRVDYEALQPVVTVEDARRAVVAVHDAIADNVLVRWEHRTGDVEACFERAATVARCRAVIPRLAAAPIEVRGCLASYDPEDDLVTLWASAQDPWRQAAQLATVLRREPEAVRVVVPHVGGAFGSKGSLAPEYGLAAWCAIHLGVPVRWFEDRSENLLASYQGRGIEADLELALDAEGRFLALRAGIAADVGAYLYPNTANVSVTTATLMTGCYDLEAVEVHLEGFATTKVPTGPYRGAGRPEAAFFLERVVDIAAAMTGIDPVELRRRNLVPPEAFPHPNGLGLTYDSGDYLGALETACNLFEYEELRAEQHEARASGRLFGVGVASYVERAAPAIWESAEASLSEAGRLLIRVGSCPHGQGHETTFAQIAADRFDVSLETVEVSHGDSAAGPAGVGTFGSRSVTLGGSAVYVACRELLEGARSTAAEMLDAKAQALSYSDGQWSAPALAVCESHVVDLAGVGKQAAAAGTPLRSQARFSIESPVFSFGAYAAAVEIDRDTGAVTVLRLVAVDDAGVLVNPLLAEGQVIGSSVQGIGAALFEEVVHDGDGQPLTTSFVSYTLASAAEVEVDFRSAFRCTPSPLNPLGAKGLGEAGTIGVPAAIGNAVADALSPLGISHVDPPYTPEKIWRLVGANATAGAGSTP